MTAAGGEARLGRALELAEATVRKYPDSPQAVTALAWAQFNLKRVDDAIRTITPVTNRPLDDADEIYIVARMLSERNQAGEARKLLDTLLSSKTLFAHRPDAEKLLQKLKS